MASLTFPTPTQLVNVGDPTANSDAATKYYVDTQISGGTVSNANYANFAGTVTSSAQPNITSLGNLTGLTSGGNVDFTGASNVALGPVTNVHITGGTSGYILQTDGTGNLSWLAPSSGSGISNGNSNINIPTVNGNINLTAVGNTTMVITGTGANISGTANVTGNLVAGNANLGNSVTANYFTGTLTTNAQPNITSVGNLSSLTVNNGVYGEVVTTQYASVFASGGGPNPYSIMQVRSSDGVSGLGMQAFTGSGTLYGNTAINFGLATIRDKDIPSGLVIKAYIDSTGLAVTGNITAANANLGNSVTANYFTGTLTTSAQPNITSVGTLTDLSVSGNGVFGGNLTVNGTLTYINSTTLSISDPIINLQTGPNGAAPVANSGKDVGTALNYFDTSAKIAWMGWDVSNAEIAFGSNVDISSEVVTFTSLANIRSGNAQLGNNVTANYFTGNGSLLTGISTASISNGNSNVNIPSANGNINLTAVGNTTLIITGTGANISGTANVTGNLIAGNITAGAGSGGNITGANLVSANFFTGTLTTNAQPNITSVGTLTSLSITGNTTSGNFIGALANGNSNVNIPSANGNINFSAVGNANVVVITGTGANISGTANVTGNLVAGNITASNINTTGSGGNIGNANVISANTFIALTSANFVAASNVNLGAVGNIKITGGTSSQYLQTDGAGNLSWSTVASGSTSNISNGNSNVNIPTANGNINFSAVGNANVVVITGTGANISGTANVTGNLVAGNITASNINTTGSGGNIGNANVISANTFTASGNITAGNFIGIFANGNSNVNIPTANGNINFSAVGNANVVVITGTGANISGTANVTGNLTAGNIIAGSGSGGNITNANVISANTFTASGNISSGNANLGNAATANFFIGSGNNLSNISGANVTGQVANALVAGTVYTAAQGNITSVGNLTGLTVSNASGVVNFTTTANVTLGAVANLHISGGTSSQYLQTDGAGNLSWSTVSSGSASNISNGNSNVNIPAANGNINFSAVGNANVVVITGTGANISGTANVTGNLTAGNIIAGSGSGGNITNANVISANTFTATGNITAGNFIGVLANGNSNVNIPTANGNINFSAVGNANVVVITGTGANIDGTANITGNLVAGNVSATLVTGTLTTNAQPNITSVGNLTGLTVSNASGIVNFTTTANVTLGAVANLHISGGTSGYVLQTDGSGTLSWVAQSGGGSTSNISNGNSNVNIPAANGNINFSAVGNANIVVITGTGANISGTANVTGNLTAGNIIAGSGSGGNITNANVISANTFTASGNITAGNFIGILANGNSNINIPAANGNINFSAVGNANVVVITGTGANIAGTANITGNLVAGNANLGNLVTANYFTGTLTTNAQPNITSVGSLTGLTVSNATGVVNLTTTANVTLGAVANLHISGGTSGYVLQTDGSGTLSWVAQSGGGSISNISNGNSNVNIPTANGNINFSAVGNANVVVITGTGANISGTANITGNLTAGNIIAGSGTGGNITNANVISANTFTATGNITAGNFIGILANGNSNVNIPSANGNINFGAVGNANVVVITGTGANITGTLNVTGQSNLGAVGNVVITGGTNGYILKTNGSGTLSWVAQQTLSIAVDSFTGDGSTVAFTLSVTPANVNYTTVNYNGAIQFKSSYTVSGTTLTFSSAPALGSAIEVTTLQFN